MVDRPADLEPRLVSSSAVVVPPGEPVEVQVDPSLKIASKVEETVGVFGPTNWWRLGIVAIVVLAAVLLLMQVMTSSPSTPSAGDVPPAGQAPVSSD